jgi:hypothetical protein
VIFEKSTIWQRETSHFHTTHINLREKRTRGFYELDFCSDFSVQPLFWFFSDEQNISFLLLIVTATAALTWKFHICSWLWRQINIFWTLTDSLIDWHHLWIWMLWILKVFVGCSWIQLLQEREFRNRTHPSIIWLSIQYISSR